MIDILKSYYIITSNNPESGEREYLHYGEWGDSWYSVLDGAKQHDSLEDATPDDGMGVKGNLVKGRTLEIWKIDVVLAAKYSGEDAEQRAKEEKLAELEAQKAAIEEQMRELRG